MKARKVLEGSSYDPNTLNAIGQAFDQAWASIASHYGTALEVERARLRLANSMLAIASEHGRDVEALRKAALAHMALNYRDKADPGAPFSGRSGISN
jgi:hypothetical protein